MSNGNTFERSTSGSLFRIIAALTALAFMFKKFLPWRIVGFIELGIVVGLPLLWGVITLAYRGFRRIKQKLAEPGS